MIDMHNAGTGIGTFRAPTSLGTESSRDSVTVSGPGVPAVLAIEQNL
jgi:hypothetical protein